MDGQNNVQANKCPNSLKSRFGRENVLTFALF